MAITNLLLANGGATSSLAVLRGGRAAVIGTSSVATQIGLAFAADSGSPFLPLLRPDGTGARFLVNSGGTAAITVLERPPTVWMRLDAIGGTFAAVTSAYVTDTTV
jgi:hypothetical protein